MIVFLNNKQNYNKMAYCNKGWSDGSCCCNCKNHIRDFYHCTTVEQHDGCVCSTPKGYICFIEFDGETMVEPRAYSGWSEHGFCELYRKKDIT